MTARLLSNAWFHATIGFALSVVLMEVLLHGIENSPAWRILPVVERELGWPDPDTGYALRRNHQIVNVRENRSRASTNNFGMRDKERSSVTPQGAFRVAISGDSFTEALQVNDTETFSRLAENTLNGGNEAGRFELLNFGMSGAGPVQQYVRLRQVVVEFAPDAIVMLIDANQFQTRELSDDSMNPAYVENSNGELEIGYGFRQRRSQRYQDTSAAKIFFASMDHSRVARAAYLRYVYGRGAVASAPSPATPHDAKRSCSRAKALVVRHSRLWDAQTPAPAARRLERFLADLSEMKQTAEIPLILALYGLGRVSADCSGVSPGREVLIAAIERKLTAHGIELWDAEQFLANRSADVEPLANLHGFGTRLGSGHLNHAGHRAYSAMMVRIVTELRDRSQRGGT